MLKQCNHAGVKTYCDKTCIVQNREPHQAIARCLLGRQALHAGVWVVYAFNQACFGHHVVRWSTKAWIDQALSLSRCPALVAQVFPGATA